MPIPDKDDLFVLSERRDAAREELRAAVKAAEYAQTRADKLAQVATPAREKLRVYQALVDDRAAADRAIDPEEWDRRVNIVRAVVSKRDAKEQFLRDRWGIEPEDDAVAALDRAAAV